MKKQELKKILENHKLWLSDQSKGQHADLTYDNLRGANLIGANLRGANLSGADLTDADLRGADLTDADLTDADLRGANLRGADLTDADLTDADLRGANLRGANLIGANLIGANLRGAVLRGANLRGAVLRGAIYNEITQFIEIACPEEGSFVAYKKVTGWTNGFSYEKTDVLIKLLIPDDARRSSATTYKCRCDKAKVLDITDLNETKHYNEVLNDSYCSTTYTVGEMVYPDSFDDDRWIECGHGIHFFLNKNNAKKY